MNDTQSAGQKEQNITSAHCGKCAGDRQCSVLRQYTEHYGDENFHGATKWMILQCRGCEYVFVQTVATDSEDFGYAYDQHGSTVVEAIERITYWPALSKRKKPEWLTDHNLIIMNDYRLNAAMIELYGALDNDLHMLAAIGIRTAYDIASELLGVDPQLRFEQKLDALIADRWIRNSDKSRLETVVDAGSASAHRGWQPNPADLKTMMDVLEHFIEESLIAPTRKKKLDAEADKVKHKVPTRQSLGKKESATSEVSESDPFA
jgi:hypothetical protein